MEPPAQIGIFTFHNERNYGANLQAYALLHYLSSNGFRVEIVDYLPNSSIVHKSTLRHLLHLVKKILSFFYSDSWKKDRRFQSFRKRYFILSENRYIGDSSILKSKLPYQVLLSGSDQIFNLTLSANSFCYYLPFENVPKISYASSFGRANISDIEKWAILRYLPSFQHLSFREETGYDIVKQLIGLGERNIVVDPVFLLSPAEWRTMVKKKTSGDFILVYAMENSPWLQSTISFVTAQYPKKKIILLSGGKNVIPVPMAHKKMTCAGPLEFLELIFNSSILITNSFHGLSFGILFSKKIFCCAHSSRNERLVHLLDRVGESEKLINDIHQAPLSIDGSSCLPKMISWIDFSKKYLIQSINEAIHD